MNNLQAKVNEHFGVKNRRVKTTRIICDKCKQSIVATDKSVESYSRECPYMNCDNELIVNLADFDRVSSPVDLTDGWLALTTFRGLKLDYAALCQVGVDCGLLVTRGSTGIRQMHEYLLNIATPLETWKICVVAKETQLKQETEK